MHPLYLIIHPYKRTDIQILKAEKDRMHIRELLINFLEQLISYRQNLYIFKQTEDKINR